MFIHSFSWSVVVISTLFFLLSVVVAAAAVVIAVEFLTNVVVDRVPEVGAGLALLQGPADFHPPADGRLANPGQDSGGVEDRFPAAGQFGALHEDGPVGVIRVHDDVDELVLADERLPDGVRHLGEVGPHGQVVEVARFGREAERRVGHDITEAGRGKVEAHAADVLHRRLGGVQVLQHVPVARELYILQRRHVF